MRNPWTEKPKLCLALLSIACLTGCLMGCLSQKAKLDLGQTYFQRQDYLQAIRYLYPLSKQGQPEALYAMGYMYFYGQGVLEDKRSAEYFFLKAARRGHQPAAIALDLIPEDRLFRKQR